MGCPVCPEMLYRNTITMKKLDPRALNADWSKYERRPTWSVVSSAELAKIINVHLQTIANWRCRSILPPSVKHSRLNANKCYFRISEIRAWLENRTEEEIHWEWIQNWMPEQMPRIHHLAHAEGWLLQVYRELGLERPLIPASFTEEQRNPVFQPWIIDIPL